jgi:hypothetical protein
MALSQRDLGLIKEMISSVGSATPSAPAAEVKCNCNCKCKCITEAQVKALVKSLDDKLNALYTELQNLKNSQTE